MPSPLFADAFQQDFANLAIASIAEGAGDAEEIAAVAGQATPGDDESFFRAWSAAADAVVAEAAGLDRDAARSAFLRAATYYSVAWHPFFGPTVNDHLAEAFAKETQALAQAAVRFDPPLEPVRIPFADHPMPGWFMPAAGHPAGTRRPLLICTNGYDGSLSSMVVHIAMAASARGYHCLLFDGPGQGSMLIEHGVPLRPDWETVMAPVIDLASSRPDVDPARVALTGWSLGGYLAPRGAVGEHRLAACIADPGMPGQTDVMRARLAANGLPAEQAAHIDQLPDDVLAMIVTASTQTRDGRWRMEQRGPLVHGVGTAAEALAALAPYSMDGRYDDVRCPVLLTAAEDDPLSGLATQFTKALGDRGHLMRFTVAEGAGDHCELMNRPLANRRMLDWLEATLPPD
jgi:alpha-beta hydrolase superfamily lysophospholipase